MGICHIIFTFMTSFDTILLYVIVCIKRRSVVQSTKEILSYSTPTRSIYKDSEYRKIWIAKHMHFVTGILTNDKYEDKE